MTEEQHDLLDLIMAFEGGELDVEGTVDLFQELVDTGLAWRLQGSYGRAAVDLIKGGHINPPAEGTVAREQFDSITNAFTRS